MVIILYPQALVLQKSKKVRVMAERMNYLTYTITILDTSKFLPVQNIDNHYIVRRSFAPNGEFDDHTFLLVDLFLKLYICVII